MTLTNEQILAILKQIESSNGANMNHPVIAYGLDKGTQAMGNYGLTNSTINDIVKRDPNYRHLQEYDPVRKKQYVEQNPNEEQYLVNSLMNRLQTRYANDPDKIAYSWNHGTYIKPDKITPEIMANDSYVQKFNLLRSKLNGATPIVKKDDNEVK